MAVKYQIEFASNNGTNYRVDIHDRDYSGQPIALQGGATPFTTEGDAEEDYYKPIRGSVGTLNIVNGHDKAGNPIDILEDILPEGNTTYPVYLMKIENNTDKIEWLGFLSSEAYTQSYTDQDEIISINVNSVLQAMDSVKLDRQSIIGTVSVTKIWCNYIHTMADLMELDITTMRKLHVFWPYNDVQITGKKINSAILFEEKEIKNEDTTSTIFVGISHTEALRKICTFMGWCAIEKEGNLFFLRNVSNAQVEDEYDYLDYMAMDRFYSSNITQYHQVPFKSVDIDEDFEWMGDKHSKSINAGANSVSVVANVGKMNEELMQLPDCPVDDIGSGYNQMLPVAGITQYIYYQANKNDTFIGNMQFYHMKVLCRRYLDDLVNISDDFVYMNESEKRKNTYLCGGQDNSFAGGIAKYLDTHVSAEYYDGYYPGESFMARMAIENSTLEAPEYISGLLMSFIPCRTDEWAGEDMPLLFRMYSNGSIHIPMDGVMTLGINFTPLFDDGIYFVKTQTGRRGDFGGFYTQIQFGDKYWDNTNKVWADNSKWFACKVSIEDGAKTYTPINVEMPVTATMEGQLKIRVRADMYITSLWQPSRTITFRGMYRMCQELFISKMEITYKSNTETTQNDRLENVYYRLLGGNFSEEKVINTDLATEHNNKPTPHVLINKDGTLMTSLAYKDGTRRPEIDLLNRMEDHYESAKRVIKIITEHPDFGTESGPDHLPFLLPMIRVADGDKTFIPVAESRDYAADSSELTLLEV